MEDKIKKFYNLSVVKKEQNFNISGDPMAQIKKIMKKLKKKQKIEKDDINEMYNQKCDSLCSIIENNKIEIENYKTIVFHAQQTMEAKDKEIEGLTSLLVQFKNKTEELEKNIQINSDKNEEKERNEIKEKEENEIKEKEENEIKEKEEKELEEKKFNEKINNLQNEISKLTEEKKNLEKKMEEIEINYKKIISEKDEKIKELNQKIENTNSNENKKKEEVIDENNIYSDVEEDDDKKEIKNNIKNEINNIEIKKQVPDEHKMLIFYNIVSENLFLNYLLTRCYSYGKIIKELVTNFDKHANNILKDQLKINNIFSNVLYEFFYRSYNKTDLNEFANEIYENNSVTQNEDYESKILENGLYSNGYVNEACINKLNERILEYKIETYNNIKELAKKCRDFIKSTSLLDHIRKYEPYLYSVNKSKLNIDLTYLTPESIGHLIVGIKYMKAKIKTVEFTGELNNDKHNECFYTYELFYQLIASHGNNITDIYFNSIKKFSIYKLISLSYSTNYFIKGINILLRGCPNLKNFYVNNCEISDDNMTDFEFNENHKYSIINFSNNKISKIKIFKSIKTVQLVLNHNKIKLTSGDNEIAPTYLDISANDFNAKDFNKYMNQSPVSILNLSEIKIAKEDEGNIISNTLISMPNLQIIYLNNCQLNIKSIPTLLNNLKKMKILELYINNNLIGNECMNALAEFIKECKSLQKIDLAGNKITTDAIEGIIDGVKENNCLKEIILSNNNMEKDKDKIIEMFKFKENLKIII